MSDYQKYRGKCKPAVEAAVADDPTLTAVRGHYICPMWGKQAHWWCERLDGSVFDPTVDQFPEPHIGDYVPFDGFLECDQCGRRVHEDEAHFNGRYGYCSYGCAMLAVGL